MKSQEVYRVTVNEDLILKSESPYASLFTKPSLNLKGEPINNRICAEFDNFEEANRVYDSLWSTGVATFRNWLDPVSEKTTEACVCKPT